MDRWIYIIVDFVHDNIWMIVIVSYTVFVALLRKQNGSSAPGIKVAQGGI